MLLYLSTDNSKGIVLYVGTIQRFFQKIFSVNQTASDIASVPVLGISKHPPSSRQLLKLWRS